MTVYLYFRGETYYPGGGTDELQHAVVADDDAGALAQVREREDPLMGYEWEELVAVDETGARRVLLSDLDHEHVVPVVDRWLAE